MPKEAASLELTVSWGDYTQTETEDDDERESLEGEATFIVAKQRNGPIGDVHLTFIDNQVRFADRSYEDEQG